MTKLSRDDVLAKWETVEACTHGNRFWCEECYEASYRSGTRVGFEEGMNLAIGHVSKLAEAAFMNHRSEAQSLREIVDQLKIEKKKNEDSRKKAKD